MTIDTEQIKKLRELTGAGIMECKRTLEEAGGDFGKAQALLIERAAEKAEKKSDRETKHGLIDAYIHGDGRIGVLVEVLCETDFLSRSEPFRRLVRDLALQIASESPLFISIDDVPPEVIRKVENEAESIARAQGKPERVIEKIKAGKVRKYLSQVCLLEQRFIKDDSMTVGDIVRTFAGRSGENVQVRFFVARTERVIPEPHMPRGPEACAAQLTRAISSASVCPLRNRPRSRQQHQSQRPNLSCRASCRLPSPAQHRVPR